MARLEQPRRKHEPVASATMTVGHAPPHPRVGTAALPRCLGHPRRALEIDSWTADATQRPEPSPEQPRLRPRDPSQPRAVRKTRSIAPSGASAPKGNRYSVAS
jgi:hypothetical protein